MGLTDTSFIGAFFYYFFSYFFAYFGGSIILAFDLALGFAIYDFGIY